MNEAGLKTAQDKFDTVVDDARKAADKQFAADVDAALDALDAQLRGPTKPKTFFGLARSLWYSSGAAAAAAAAATSLLPGLGS